MEEIARWAYILFVVIAIVAGLAVGYMAYEDDPNLADIHAWVTLTMLILGVIIGITSLTSKEVTPFLIATIALLVAANADVWQPLDVIHGLLYEWAKHILSYIVAFSAPAAVIIAARSIFAMARDK